VNRNKYIRLQRITVCAYSKLQVTVVSGAGGKGWINGPDCPAVPSSDKES